MSFTACFFRGIAFRGVACVHEKLGFIFGHNGYNFCRIFYLWLVKTDWYDELVISMHCC